jgi:hypothetical protein
MVEGLRSNSDDDPHTVAMIKDDDFFSYVDDMALLDAFIDGNPLPGEEEVPIALAASSSGPELASGFKCQDVLGIVELSPTEPVMLDPSFLKRWDQ